MRRVGKGCSGVETPLFKGMLVAREPEVQGDAEEQVQGNDNDAAQGANTAVSGDDVAQDLEIIKLKTRVKKLEKANKGTMIDELDRDEGAALMGEKEKEKKAEEDKDIAGDEHVKGRQAQIYQIDKDHAAKVLSMQEDEPEVQEVVEVVTTAKLIIKVVTAASTPVSAASAIILAAKPKVPAATITAVPVKVASTR
nr:hypothetical protein [Tanacetum cinerariifolium]GFB15794.1 hypothetical protein [Tanacetum cinerariifolium]